MKNFSKDVILLTTSNFFKDFLMVSSGNIQDVTGNVIIERLGENFCRAIKKINERNSNKGLVSH